MEVQSVTVGFVRFKESPGCRNSSIEVTIPLTGLWDVEGEDHSRRKPFNVSTRRWRGEDI